MNKAEKIFAFRTYGDRNISLKGDGVLEKINNKMYLINNKELTQGYEIIKNNMAQCVTNKRELDYHFFPIPCRFKEILFRFELKKLSKAEIYACQFKGDYGFYFEKNYLEKLELPETIPNSIYFIQQSTYKNPGIKLDWGHISLMSEYLEKFNLHTFDYTSTLKQYQDSFEKYRQDLIDRGILDKGDNEK